MDRPGKTGTGIKMKKKIFITRGKVEKTKVTRGKGGQPEGKKTTKV